jgi:hypothetical protein
VDGRPAALPSWAGRIRRERVARRWSQAEAVRAFQLFLPDDDSSPAARLLDWSRWEAGLVLPPERCRQALAETFGTVTGALFPGPAGLDPPEPELSPLEVLTRIRSPDLDGATLEALAVQVDDLCTRYARTPAAELLAETQTWQARLTGLLGHRLTLHQHREVLRLSGFLALLTACLEWDLGRTTRAGRSRRIALSLGAESGSAEVLAWAGELQAWFALAQGDYRTVISAADSGPADGPVAGQLSAQAAQAWARIGERRPMEVALDTARRRLEAQGRPENPGNHFVVDPSRFDLWAMECYRWLGADRPATRYAQAVLNAGGSPMRTAAAELTLAVVAARAGELEAALHHGHRAWGGERVSLPGLLIGSRQLAHLLEQNFPTAEPVGRYLGEQRRLERQLLGWSPSPPL